MPIYEVRPGCTHGALNQHKAGDRVELTAEEAAGFLDKLLEAAEDAPPVRPVPPAPKPAVLPAETGGGAPSSSLPAASGDTAEEAPAPAKGRRRAGN